MGLSNGENVKQQQVLDFTPPDDGAKEHMQSLSADNGLGSLRLGDIKSVGAGKDDNSKSGSDKVIDLSKPIDSSKDYKGPPPDATKAPPMSDGTDALKTGRGDASLDVKFDEYPLPDGGKLLVGKSDYRDVPFQPVIVDKNGQYVRNTGGGASGGGGPNGEKIPETRFNAYGNGASDHYTEGDDKYHYTDSNGKEHTIQLKDKISFKQSEEPDVDLPEKELRPAINFDPNKPLEESMKEKLPPEQAATLKAQQYDLPDGDKFVTWEFAGSEMAPLVVNKNGDAYVVRGGGGGGGGGGIDADGIPYSTRGPNEHLFSNGARGQWNEGSSDYTYIDRSGKVTVLQLSKPM